MDGHAPLLSAKDLNSYIAAGVQSDHECSNIEEAMEKFRLGQYIMIREGTAAKNMEALMPLFREPYCSRIALRMLESMCPLSSRSPGCLSSVTSMQRLQ